MGRATSRESIILITLFTKHSYKSFHLTLRILRIRQRRLTNLHSNTVGSWRSGWMLQGSRNSRSYLMRRHTKHIQKRNITRLMYFFWILSFEKTRLLSPFIHHFLQEYAIYVKSWKGFSVFIKCDLSFTSTCNNMIKQAFWTSNFRCAFHVLSDHYHVDLRSSWAFIDLNRINKCGNRFDTKAKVL